MFIIKLEIKISSWERKHNHMNIPFDITPITFKFYLWTAQLPAV